MPPRFPPKEDVTEYTDRTPSAVPPLGKPREKPDAVVAVSIDVEKKPADAAVSGVTSTLIPVLVKLLALHQVYYAAHWFARGPTFYGDHLLFERLYGSVKDEFDGLAERIIGLEGPFDIASVLTQAGQQASAWTKGSPDATVACEAEKDFQATLARAYKSLGSNLTLGLDNFLQGIADNHETNCYLLRQRLA